MNTHNIPRPQQHPNAVTMELLRAAYKRPCFVCEGTGPCKHRQPDVELALMRIRPEGN
jgi:hypothetical protein